MLILFRMDMYIIIIVIKYKELNQNLILNYPYWRNKPRQIKIIHSMQIHWFGTPSLRKRTQKQEYLLNCEVTKQYLTQG